MEDNKESTERVFLHDMASPLGTAMLLLDMLRENIASYGDQAKADVDQLDQAYKALEKMKTMLMSRRESLIKQVAK